MWDMAWSLLLEAINGARVFHIIIGTMVNIENIEHYNVKIWMVHSNVSYQDQYINAYIEKEEDILC